MYDLIGDIHGHADELVQLLETLRYQQDFRSYAHAERKVIFLGDFIDRGPQIREVLEIVRPMVEERKALAVMGNHEFNALAFHTEDPNRAGTFLRRRDNKNIRQHYQTILQLSDKELAKALDWFRTLPMWLDLDGLRVVHACWDERAMSKIAQARQETSWITTPFLQAACKKGNSLFDAVETVLKGKEAELPNGVCFTDKDNHVRREIRTRWYLSPDNHIYGDYALQSDPIVCPETLAKSVIAEAVPYPTTASPVFIGHYWLWTKETEGPKILADNVACLDYSVAKKGFLCAYRWDGERKLKNENFVRT